MVYEGRIQGKFVYLVSASVEDAEFTLSLRQNPTITKYLPKLDITLKQQEAWITAQREKENDYFFVAKTNENVPIGTVSIYNINGDISESGRLALMGNAPQNTEASMLLFRFAFDILHLKEVTGFIIAGNRRAERYNRQFGCVVGAPEADETGEMICRTRITGQSFHRAERELEKILYRSMR